MLSRRSKVIAGVGGAFLLYKAVDNTFQVSHDIRVAAVLGPYKRDIGRKIKSGYNTTDAWLATLKKHENKEALVCEDRSMTFGAVERLSNRIAHWAIATGLRPGDVVGLDMENRLEYIPTWLGLTKVGVKIAMLNYNVKAKGLLHCVTVASCKAVVFGTEVVETIAAIAAPLRASGVLLFSYGPRGPPAWADGDVDTFLAGASEGAPPAELRAGIGMTDTFAYVYTSGTTGLPKACKVLHLKMYGSGAGFPKMFGTTAADRLYCTLPLYHSAGGGIGACHMVVLGCTLIIKRKFSATHFWADCVKYRATMIQYIGELCRYLLAAPRTPLDEAHGVRIAFGNGLRPEIWNAFQRRFKIKEVGEFYGSTEGNVVLFNHCRDYDGQGAIGRAGWILRKLQGFKVAKFDVVREQPVRGADGLCVEAAADEPGELLGVVKAGDAMTRFDGYTSSAATEQKLLRDAFRPGDLYFRTGDLVRIDGRGMIYFVDRIGDTFRWKGENVSTMEVSEVISALPGVAEANVFGVRVPGRDGRACMVAVVLDGGAAPSTLDAAALYDALARGLPAYSIPLFIRFLPGAMSLSAGTFKHRKVELREDAFDLTKVNDTIWWLRNGSYAPFTMVDYQAVATRRAARL